MYLAFSSVEERMECVVKMMGVMQRIGRFRVLFCTRVVADEHHHSLRHGGSAAVLKIGRHY